MANEITDSLLRINLTGKELGRSRTGHGIKSCDHSTQEVLEEGIHYGIWLKENGPKMIQHSGENSNKKQSFTKPNNNNEDSEKGKNMEHLMEANNGERVIIRNTEFKGNNGRMESSLDKGEKILSLMDTDNKENELQQGAPLNLRGIANPAIVTDHKGTCLTQGKNEAARRHEEGKGKNINMEVESMIVENLIKGWKLEEDSQEPMWGMEENLIIKEKVLQNVGGT
ncbi:hypothetical protein ACH5RR_029577 [Cinchona calisaya]|uniref:Uncharacterized protein n=1 Tax=Cinchona calisaya TaxID=153742 RepID=A0ABD2YUC8_9GENT